jgi:Protein of unknown function (DUF2971)
MQSRSSLAYKYRSGDKDTLARDLKSLADSTFYAAERQALNDPFEGRLDRTSFDSQIAALKMLVSRSVPSVSKSLDAVSKAAQEVLSFVDKCGVYSLSNNPLLELVWAHYGGSHRGFCIGYNIQKLIGFEPNHNHVLNVEYSNMAPTITSSDLLLVESVTIILQKILGVKSMPWAYEDEVRVITHMLGHNHHDYRAVKVIYFGLRCPESTISAVMETLTGRDVTYQQVISPHSTYLLKSVAIPDKYASSPKYKLNCAPIIDGAILPDYLKPEQRQYAAYLSKAAEIVRREPYCKEIQLVDFSADKSTPTRPVIFVQYLRDENKWVNHYLTIPEIDKQFTALRIPENMCPPNSHTRRCEVSTEFCQPPLQRKPLGG